MIFYALTRPTGHFFLACELPNGLASTVSIDNLHGSGEQNTWQAVSLVANHPVVNNIISLYAPFRQNARQTWQSNIRTLAFTYQEAVAPAGPGAAGARRAGNRGGLDSRISNLVFGCFGTDDGPHVHRWIVLYRDQGPALSFPGRQIVQHLPVLLGQNWKSVVATNGRLGLFTTQQAALQVL
jgi:hypothetical protein